MLSCPDGMGKALERYLEGKDLSIDMSQTQAPSLEYYDPNMVEKNHDDNSLEIVGVCPECGNSLVYEGGCSNCYSCGYSKCS